MKQSMFFSWVLGVSLLAAPACLSGCVAKISGAGSGGGGGGSEELGGGGAALIGTGEGGEGGAGAGTQTATQTSVPKDPECFPVCADGEVCVDGECSGLRQVWLAASRDSSVQDDGSVEETGTVSACEQIVAPQPAEPPIAQEGACDVYAPSGVVSPYTAQFGPVIASASSFASTPLSVLDFAPHCAAAAVDPTPAFLDGEMVSFEVGTGEHNPAFSISAPSPPQLAFTSDVTLVPGEPLHFAWSTDGAPPQILVFDPYGGNNSMVCHPTQGTSLIVGGSLTALLAASSGELFVTAFVSLPPVQIDVTPAYRAFAANQRGVHYSLELVPPP